MNAGVKMRMHVNASAKTRVDAMAVVFEYLGGPYEIEGLERHNLGLMLLNMLSKYEWITNKALTDGIPSSPLSVAVRVFSAVETLRLCSISCWLLDATTAST